MIKRPYLSFTLLLLLSMCILGGCEKEKSHTVLELFSESQSLSPKKDFYVNEDSIAIIEGLSCDGKNLIVNDVNSTLAVSNIRNRTYTNCEVYLIDYGYGNFKEKIHFME